MAVRWYIVPIIEAESGPWTSREPKYFSGSGVTYGAIEYGGMPVALVAADVTPAQHTAVSGQSDVIAAPLDIDNTISAGALPAVVSALETLRIPAGWVTTSHTYRDVLRVVAGLFQFSQRFQRRHARVMLDTETLDMRWDDLPTAAQERIQDTAESFGYDSTVPGNPTVATILKALADAWGNAEFYAGPGVL